MYVNVCDVSVLNLKSFDTVLPLYIRLLCSLCKHFSVSEEIVVGNLQIEEAPLSAYFR